MPHGCSTGRFCSLVSRHPRFGSCAYMMHSPWGRGRVSKVFPCLEVRLVGFLLIIIRQGGFGWEDTVLDPLSCGAHHFACIPSVSV